MATLILQQQRKKQHLESGEKAERLAEAFLLKQGLQTLVRNHRCKCGELDLIMTEQNTAVIVEVKLRNTTTHGSGVEAVNPSKRRRVSHCAALWWTNCRPKHLTDLRFDVVAVRKDEIEQWVKHAWQTPI